MSERSSEIYWKNVRRVIDDLAGSFDEYTSDIWDEIAPLCESPIEMMFGTAFAVGSNLAKISWAICTQDEEDTALLKYDSVLMAQYLWMEYRIDWVWKIKSPKGLVTVFVECDGHDFHERTKEQAARDRKKDRDIQAAGIPILRFTGQEIFNSPLYCVISLYNFVYNSKGGVK